ncbi:MAG: YdcF family protein, partial [Lachnospiraceae bacterium]|nr:YdcF family protein [Lachnospiraceae bacterium]
MASVFGIVAIFCLVYYGVILVYSGIGTSLSVVWLILAALLALMGVVVHFYPLFRHRVPIRMEVSVVTFFTAIFAVFVFVELAIGVNFFSLQKQSTDYVVVLGYQVQDGRISRTLEHRLDKAYEYAQVHPNTVFILSGGKNGDENVSEAELMYDYLKKRGVLIREIMFLEDEYSLEAKNRISVEAKVNGRYTLTADELCVMISEFFDRRLMPSLDGGRILTRYYDTFIFEDEPVYTMVSATARA